MTIGKKTGYFLLGLLALPAAIGVQFMLMVPATGLTLLGIVMEGARSGEAVLDRIIDVYLGERFQDLFQLAYALIIIAVFGLWFFKTFGKEVRPVFRHRRRFVLLLCGLALLMVGLQYAIEIVYEISASLLPRAAEAYEELTELAGFNDPTVLLMIYGVILGPIAEELIFRGVSFHFLKRAVPLPLAIVIQAGLFGIYHMNVMQGIYTFFAGVLFGFICEKSGSILYSVLAHMIFNLYGFTTILYLGSDSPYFNFIWMPLMVLTLILGSMLFFGKLPARQDAGGSRL